nr:inclusion body protein [Dahlia common mosaic virus]
MEEELKALRFRKKVLEIELKSLCDKISLYEEMITTDISVQDPTGIKTEASPSQTVDGKDGKTNPLKPVALVKSKTVKTEPSPVQDETVKENGANNTSSPVANGSGKGTSNPLMADTLPKSEQEVSLKPTYSQAAMKPPRVGERYYVVYNGKGQGIYDDWAQAAKNIEKGTIAKKFSHYDEASISASSYTIKYGEKIPWKGMKPIVPKNQERKRLVDRIPQPENSQQDNFPETSFDEFMNIWKKARRLSPESFNTEHLCSDDKASRSFLIIGPNADPDLTFRAFNAGLVKTIYPSNNLQEIGRFPEGFKKAIKKYRSKIAAAKDASIYIQCTSSIPDWEEGNSYQAYHLIEIGLSGKRDFNPSQEMVDSKDLLLQLSQVRVNGFIRILQKSQLIDGKTKIKINYAQEKVLIMSHYGAPISRQDVDILSSFEESIAHAKVDVGTSTKLLLCKQLKKLLADNHKCSACESGASTSNNTSFTACSDSSSNNGEKDVSSDEQGSKDLPI